MSGRAAAPRNSEHRSELSQPHQGPRTARARAALLKKRAEGHKHIPAVIALARRRVDVLWALLRDNRHFTTTPPPADAATAA